MQSFLIMPIQRVPRYRMLLEALVACVRSDAFGDKLQRVQRTRAAGVFAVLSAIV